VRACLLDNTPGNSLAGWLVGSMKLAEIDMTDVLDTRYSLLKFLLLEDYDKSMISDGRISLCKYILLWLILFNEIHVKWIMRHIEFYKRRIAKVGGGLEAMGDIGGFRFVVSRAEIDP
jgi:hypothetical protein